MSASNELAEKVIAALQDYQGPHVSLACRDCAEGAWEVVLNALTEAGYEIVKTPTEAVQWPEHPLYVCGHQHASRDEAAQCPVYKEWRAAH